MSENKGFLATIFDLSFSEFVTTKIIKALFILLLIASGLGALGIITAGFASGSAGKVIGSLILAPLAFLLYAIAARVYLEIIMVIFRIAENTQKLADKGSSE